MEELERGMEELGVEERPEEGHPILDLVLQTVTSDGWTFTRDTTSTREILRAGAEGRNGTYRVIIEVKEESEILIVYIFSNAKIPEAMRDKASEYLTRANYGIILGNFEMDFNDGELRYKVSSTFVGGQLAPRTIEVMVNTAAKTMDRYFPGVLAVCYGHVDPAQAVREVEEGEHEDASPQ